MESNMVERNLQVRIKRLNHMNKKKYYKQNEMLHNAHIFNKYSPQERLKE